jgi:hypothetical protein
VNLTLEISLISAGSAIAGAFFGSIVPAVVTYLNSRAETSRERLRLAVQLALAEHAHLMESARATAIRTTQTVPVAPIAATFIYHLQLLDLTKKSLEVKPADLVILRQHGKYILDALIANDPGKAP